MISHDHPRNLPLYEAAQERGLACERLSADLFAVSSYSVPGRKYKVQVGEGGYLCSCQAAWANQACSHGALAIVRAFPSLLTDWHVAALRREWREKQRQITLALLWPWDEPVKKVVADIKRLDAEAAEILGTEKIAA